MLPPLSSPIIDELPLISTPWSSSVAADQLYTVLATPIALQETDDEGPSQQYRLVDMFFSDPAMFIKYIGVMYETRAGVEDEAWLFRGYTSHMVATGEWVGAEGCERLDAVDALSVARETIQKTVLAKLDSGINAAIMECSLQIFFREFCPTSSFCSVTH
jgi:hypothetical protein